MTIQLLDIISSLTVEEHFHSAQLPVGNPTHVLELVGHIFVFVFGLVYQREGGYLFLIQPNQVLLIAGQTRRGFQIVKLGSAHLVLHIGDVGISTFIGGVLGSGGIVQRAPVGVGEQLGEDLLGLSIGLGHFIIRKPPVEPRQAEKGGQEEDQDEHKVQRVEDHAAQPGAGLLLFRSGLLRGRSGTLCGSLGSIGPLGIAAGLSTCGALRVSGPLNVGALLRRPLTGGTLTACGPLRGRGRPSGSALLGGYGFLSGRGRLRRGGALHGRRLHRRRLGRFRRSGFVDIIQPA